MKIAAQLFRQASLALMFCVPLQTALAQMDDRLQVDYAVGKSLEKLKFLNPPVSGKLVDQPLASGSAYCGIYIANFSRKTKSKKLSQQYILPVAVFVESRGDDYISARKTYWMLDKSDLEKAAGTNFWIPVALNEMKAAVYNVVMGRKFVFDYSSADYPICASRVAHIKSQRLPNQANISSTAKPQYPASPAPG